MTSNTTFQLLEGMLDTLTSEDLLKLEEYIRSRKSQVCRLLNLPPEIRNKIYGLVLCDTSHAKMLYSRKVYGLFATCHQLRTEYSSVSFSPQSWHAEVLVADEQERA